VTIDYQFGIAASYRIFYSDGFPANIERLAELCLAGRCVSVVDGEHCIAATASDYRIVLWDLINGTILRDLALDGVVTALDVDESFGGVWAATEKTGFLFSVNGKELIRLPLPRRVAALALLGRGRAVLCGCDDGGIAVVHPKVVLGRADVVWLPSEHRSAVARFALHPTGRCFVSVDSDGVAFAWTAIAEGAVPIPIEEVSTCALCRERRASAHCVSCARMVCADCCVAERCAVCAAVAYM
jgi:hypothetical protein